MHHSKRTIIGLIVILMISALSLAACGGESSSSRDPVENETSLLDAVPTSVLSTEAIMKERAADLSKTTVGGTIKLTYDRYGFMAASLRFSISGVELLPYSVTLHMQKHNCETGKISKVSAAQIVSFDELAASEIEEKIYEVGSLLGRYEVPGIKLVVGPKKRYTLSLQRNYVSLPGIAPGKITYWFTLKNYEANTSEPTPKKTAGSCKS